MRKLVSVGITATGTMYALPLRRPRWCSAAHTGTNRRPASSRATLLNYFAAAGGRCHRPIVPRRRGARR